MQEETRRREHGLPNTLEARVLPERSRSACGFFAEGAAFHDGSARLLAMEGLPLEAQLKGTILYLRNRDEPGVGDVGTKLEKLGVSIATFALGRKAVRGEEAAAPVRLDGPVSATILDPIRAIPAITEAKLLRLG